MNLSSDEKRIVKSLVQHELEAFKKEGKSITLEDHPDFPAAEEKYEEFLVKLLKKI